MKEPDLKEIRVYARISTRERAINGYGLDMQINKNIEYLKLYDLYENANLVVYRDDGYSAKDMNRPGMNKLVKEIKEGKIDTVIIYKLDRLSRNVVNVYEFLKMLIDNKCNLVSVVDQLDIHSANGRLIVGILAIVAQWERETVIERTHDALLQMAMEGKYPVGHTPFGYEKKDNKLYINEQEAKFVRKAFDLAVGGYLPIEIYRKLKDDGLQRNYKNGASFVKKFLAKKHYFGHYEFKGKSFKDVVPPIITEKIYYEASAISKKKYKRNNNVKYYYGYKIRCTCGEICECKSTKKTVSSGNSLRYYYYYCNVCKHRINQNDLIKESLYRINEKEQSDDVQEEERSKHKKLNRVNIKIDKLYDQYITDAVDEKTYLFALGKLTREKSDLLRITRLTIKQKKQWNKMNNVTKKAYIQKYIKNIVVDLNLKEIIKFTLN